MSLFDGFSFFAVNLFDNFVLFLLLRALLKKKVKVADKYSDGVNGSVLVLHRSLGKYFSLN